MTIVSIIVPSVLEVGKKAEAFIGGVSDTSARLFDKVVYWKEEKRRRRSSGEIAFAQSERDSDDRRFCLHISFACSFASGKPCVT